MSNNMIKITLSDDHALLREALANLMNSFEEARVVQTVGNGLELMESMKSHEKPDVVVLDLNMPKMGGIEFLRELRNNDHLKNISVFVMTTSNEDNDKIDAYNLNVAGYILKPLSMDQFMSVVSTLSNYWKLCEFPV